jgi:hypothetical protein
VNGIGPSRALAIDDPFRDVLELPGQDREVCEAGTSDRRLAGRRLLAQGRIRSVAG